MRLPTDVTGQSSPAEDRRRAPDPVLAVTLSRAVEGGANVRGSATGGGLLYALPRLGFDSVLCVGGLPRGTLLALVRSAHHVTVVRRGPGAGQLRRFAGRQGWTGLRVVAAPDAVTHPVQLLVLGRGTRRWPPAQRAALDALLAADAVVCSASVGPARHVPDGSRRLVALPRTGDVKVVAPAEDDSLLAGLPAAGLLPTRSGRPKLARLERRLARFPAVARLDRRTALVDGAELADLDGPPRYVREAAAQAGLSLAGWRWAVVARGQFATQKVVVLLAPPGRGPATVLVKVTRDAVHNERLRNEGRALRELAAIGVPGDRVPRVLFDGLHAGRALLGQVMLPGTPFRSRMSGRPDDPVLDAALGWFTELGERTVHRHPTAHVTDALELLLDQWRVAVQPDHRHLAVLRSEIAALRDLSPHLPSVLQHGDPGPWNLLVDARGGCVVLDWESAELSGMPLWDLLHLFRSSAAQPGRRRAGAVGSDLFLRRSAWNDRLGQAVGAYAERIGLPAGAVRPLTLTCWLQRSWKQVSQSTAPGRARTPATRLLLELLDAGDALRLPGARR